MERKGLINNGMEFDTSLLKTYKEWFYGYKSGWFNIFRAIQNSIYNEF